MSVNNAKHVFNYGGDGMKLLRATAEGLPLFKEKLDICFYAQQRISEEQKEQLHPLFSNVYLNPATGFIGINASGKTSVLKVILLNAQTGREHTSATLKKTLDENHFDEYRSNLIAIVDLPEYTRTTVGTGFNNLMKDLFKQSSITGADVMSRLPSHFMEEPFNEIVPKVEHNVFVDPIRGRRIQFDTVHGVKGETHDATLYLETEMKNSSDIVRVLPWFGVGKPGKSPLYDYSRKLVYVGMNRKRKDC